MKRFVFEPDFTDRLIAGELHCPRCVYVRTFWVVAGHENSEDPDLECETCGYLFTKIQKIVVIKDGDEPVFARRSEHQVKRRVRAEALKNYVDKRARMLKAQGFAVEDIPTDVVSGDFDGEQ